jgi:hypothetical protein
LFKWIKRKQIVYPFKGSLYDNKIKLPFAGITDLANYYKDYKFDGIPDEEQPKVHVHLVAIYNIDQLASEIVKCLKNSTSDGSKGN